VKPEPGGLMLHPDRALEIIKNIDINIKTEVVTLENALGRTLAEAPCSAIDSPPFDKSAMDGFAYKVEDEGKALKIIETIAAGAVPTKTVGTGECSKIMTGAMIPEGANKVVKVENCSVEDDLLTFDPEQNWNVIKQGENLKIGDVLMDKKVLQPQDIGILAASGVAEVVVAKQPFVGIITTGTELREPGEKLDRGQIYNSNGWQIRAQVLRTNCKVDYLGSVPDDKASTSQMMKLALDKYDVVILSGGVSMGEFDYVPEMLQKNGVNIHFHKMAIKPGKPTLFGQKNDTFVFGLPGNPVSTFVIFEIYVKTLISKLLGYEHNPVMLQGTLAQEVKRRRTERVEYIPVNYQNGEIKKLTYHGSAHLNALSMANAFIRLEQGEAELKKGSVIYARQI